MAPGKPVDVVEAVQNFRPQLEGGGPAGGRLPDLMPPLRALPLARRRRPDRLYPFVSTECKLWSEGGCPCAEGEVKCDGWCQPEPKDVCCDWPTEYACYDDDWTVASCVPASESCPSSGQAQDYHHMSKLITPCGTPEEIARFRSLKTKHHKLSAGGGASPMSSAKHAIEHRMMALARTVKLHGGLQKGSPSAKNDMQKKHMADLIKAKGAAQKYHHMSELITSRGTPKEIANFRHLERKYHKLSADGGKAPMGHTKHVVKHEMMPIARTIELRGGLHKGNPFAKNEQISFVRCQHTNDQDWVAYCDLLRFLILC